jgi:hypothetical protein
LTLVLTAAVDSFRIHRHALTATDIAALHREGQ